MDICFSGIGWALWLSFWIFIRTMPHVDCLQSLNWFSPNVMRWSSESFQQLCTIVSLTTGTIMGYCTLVINCLAMRPSYTHGVIPRRESRISWLFGVESANAMQSMSCKSQSNVLANLLKPEQVVLCVSCTWGVGGSDNACLQPRKATAPRLQRKIHSSNHGWRRWFSPSTLLLWYPTCNTVSNPATPTQERHGESMLLTNLQVRCGRPNSFSLLWRQWNLWSPSAYGDLHTSSWWAQSPKELHIL